jgi:hypothetical protein
MEPGAGWSDEVVEFVRREVSGAVALSLEDVSERSSFHNVQLSTKRRTAWNVEFRKHVFCSLMIPIGLSAVGRPSEGEAAGLASGGGVEVYTGWGCSSPLGSGDTLNALGVADGESVIQTGEPLRWS